MLPCCPEAHSTRQRGKQPRVYAAVHSHMHQCLQVRWFNAYLCPTGSSEKHAAAYVGAYPGSKDCGGDRCCMQERCTSCTQKHPQTQNPDMQVTSLKLDPS